MDCSSKELNSLTPLEILLDINSSQVIAFAIHWMEDFKKPTQIPC
jgi:hypothetical protein